MANPIRSARKAYRLVWRGQQVVKDVTDNVAEAWTEFGLTVERNSKAQLVKGHGVISGTLRRSIHMAQPGYNWTGDNVLPDPGSPERGRRRIKPLEDGDHLRLQVGSGMIYALAVELGHGTFAGYRYLRNGLAQARRDLPQILQKFVARKMKKK